MMVLDHNSIICIAGFLFIYCFFWLFAFLRFDVFCIRFFSHYYWYSSEIQGQGANSSEANNGHIEESNGAKPTAVDILPSKVRVYALKGFIIYRSDQIDVYIDFILFFGFCSWSPLSLHYSIPSLSLSLSLLSCLFLCSIATYATG